MKINKGLSLLALVALSGCGPDTQKDVQELDKFAQCLTENGATMYGVEWCPGCNAQKKLFKDSFQYINYVDCEKERQTCRDAYIILYPTWTDKNGMQYIGAFELETLGQIFNCPCP